MENNMNQTPETVEEKVGIFTKVKTGIKSVGDKIPAPVKKVLKIGTIVGGVVITTAILGKHVDIDTGTPDDETDPEEEEKKEETPF